MGVAYLHNVHLYRVHEYMHMSDGFLRAWPGQWRCLHHSRCCLETMLPTSVQMHRHWALDWAWGTEHGIGRPNNCYCASAAPWCTPGSRLRLLPSPHGYGQLQYLHVLCTYFGTSTGASRANERAVFSSVWMIGRREPRHPITLIM